MIRIKIEDNLIEIPNKSSLREVMEESSKKREIHRGGDGQ